MEYLNKILESEILNNLKKNKHIKQQFREKQKFWVNSSWLRILFWSQEIHKWKQNRRLIN